MAWNSVRLEQWWNECGNLEIDCNCICNCEQENGYSSLQECVWERDIEKKKLEWRTYLRRLVLLHLCHCTEWRSGEGISRRVIWRRRPRQRRRRHHPDHHPPIKMYISRGWWFLLELLLPARKWARFGQCSLPPSCEVPFAGDGVVVATGSDILFMWKMDMRMSNESLSNSNGSWSSSVVNSSLMGCCLNATMTTISWPGICIYRHITLISHFFGGFLNHCTTISNGSCLDWAGLWGGRRSLLHSFPVQTLTGAPQASRAWGEAQLETQKSCN